MDQHVDRQTVRKPAQSNIYIYIYIYDGVNKIRTILGRNPDKSRNTYKNKVLIIKLLYFYRAQPCTIITVL